MIAGGGGVGGGLGEGGGSGLGGDGGGLGGEGGGSGGGGEGGAGHATWNGPFRYCLEEVPPEIAPSANTKADGMLAASIPERTTALLMRQVMYPLYTSIRWFAYVEEPRTAVFNRLTPEAPVATLVVPTAQDEDVQLTE